MAGKGTTHHKVHNYTGWGLIIGLPFAICCAICAIRGGTAGFVEWLSHPAGALGLLAFVTAALWYVKLEFDEVVRALTGSVTKTLLNICAAKRPKPFTSLSTGACRSRGRTKARFISARSADTPQKWAMARPYSALARRLTAPVTLCCTRFMANP